MGEKELKMLFYLCRSKYQKCFLEKGYFLNFKKGTMDNILHEFDGLGYSYKTKLFFKFINKGFIIKYIKDDKTLYYINKDKILEYLGSYEIFKLYKMALEDKYELVRI